MNEKYRKQLRNHTGGLIILSLSSVISGIFECHAGGNKMAIKVRYILKIDESSVKNYKLHLACWNREDHPLDVYLRSWDEWVGWNKWRGEKNDFSREYIFSLIDT